MKIVFIADNRNRPNWGCRATSIALKDLLREAGHQIIYTVYGDCTMGYEPTKFHGNDILVKLYNVLYGHVSIVRWLSRKFDRANVIRHNVNNSLSNYEKAIRTNSVWKHIDKYMQEADAVVVNAEGTFIFSTPERYDTVFYLLMLKVAQNYKKKTYCLNGMFSDCPISKRNVKMLQQTKEVLKLCDMVTARDPLSLQYYQSNILANIKYVPDALFTWIKYNKYIDVAVDYPLAIIPYPEYDSHWNSFNFSEPYICLSGSSLSAKNTRLAIKTYSRLAEKLKENWNVVVVATCSGDRFLKDVATTCNLPYVPVDVNILAGMSILCHADVFVSGRWHPSILASLGGTPCVFMGSNSHKTKAIQMMIDYGNVCEYNAFPTDDDINNIVNRCNSIIKNGTTLREQIRTKAMDLSDKSIDGNVLIN